MIFISRAKICFKKVSTLCASTGLKANCSPEIPGARPSAGPRGARGYFRGEIEFQFIEKAPRVWEGMGGGGEGFLGDSIGSNSVEDQTLWMRRWTLVSAGIVWFPVVFIPTMKEVAPLAAFGLLATMLCVIEVIVFAFIIGPIT